MQALPEAVGELSAADSVRLLSALSSMPDPCKRGGIRHSLQALLLLVVGAVVAGRTSSVGIAGWAARADHPCG